MIWYELIFLVVSAFIVYRDAHRKAKNAFLTVLCFILILSSVCAFFNLLILNKMPPS